jgi:hypothetical protein
MSRKFIIKASKQITLPVTPESFEVSYGRNIETVNIHEVGDVNIRRAGIRVHHNR